MSWGGVDPAVREIAEEVCSDRQLEVLKLMAAGYSLHRISRALGIDRRTVRDRRDRAMDNINRALEERQETAQ